MTSTSELLKRISINPKVLSGKPVIGGTRIPVYLILELLATGLEEEKILEEYPELTKTDIKACIAYASQLVQGEQVIPIKS